MKIIIRQAWNRRGYNVWLYREDGSTVYLAKPFEITFEETGHDGATLLPDPSLELTEREFNEFKTSLVTELQSNGLLDPGAAETARELKAVRYHLEDMRSLALAGRKTDEK